MWVAYRKIFVGFEIVSTIAFVFEYIMRLWVCVEQARFSAPFIGRVRYALNPLAIIDLVVICTIWTSVDLRFLRIARIVRLLRVLHLENFEESLRRITKGLQIRKELIIVSITLMVICIYATSAVIYQLEHKVQPTVFTSIQRFLVGYRNADNCWIWGYDPSNGLRPIDCRLRFCFRHRRFRTADGYSDRSHRSRGRRNKLAAMQKMRASSGCRIKRPVAYRTSLNLKSFLLQYIRRNRKQAHGRK